MKTMLSKFPGVCRECSQPIKRGESIAYYGRGLGIAHSACHEDESHESNEDAACGLEYGTLANDRRMARNGLSVTRFASGHVMTQNSRGRC